MVAICTFWSEPGVRDNLDTGLQKLLEIRADNDSCV
jgi:hypothetical protein